MVLVASATLFYACNQEEDLNVQEDILNITVKNGYLVFKNDEIFKQTIEETKDMSRKELDDWEKQFNGFTSMRSIYEKAIDEDEIFFESMTKEKYNELSKIDEIPHSDFVNKHKDLFVFDKDDGTFRPKMPLVKPELYALANGQRVMKIASEIRLFSSNYITYITDGDETKLTMAKKLTTSDKSNGIIVHNYQIRKVGIIKNGRLDWNLTCGCEGYTSGGGQRVQGFVWESKHYGSGAYANGKIVDLYIEAINQKKNFWWHKKRTSQLRVEGFISYAITGFYSSTIPINWTTGGQLKTSIKSFYTIWTQGGLNTLPTITYDGSVNFYGRHGTHCNLPNDDSNCE